MSAPPSESPARACDAAGLGNVDRRAADDLSNLANSASPGKTGAERDHRIVQARRTLLLDDIGLDTVGRTALECGLAYFRAASASMLELDMLESLCHMLGIDGDPE